MQQQILRSHSRADLHVYAVWFNMLFGDNRGAWDGDGMADPRVMHFWDQQKVVGNWFSAILTHRGNPTWDFYALYNPDATWQTEPPAALSSGGTIIARRDQLQAAIAPYLRVRSGAPAGV